MTNKQLLEKIKCINWQYVVIRRETLLLKSLIDLCYKYFYKVTGIFWHPHFVLRLGEGEKFLPSEKLTELNSVFSSGDLQVFIRFRKNLLKYVSNLDKLAKKIEKIDCSCLPQLKLLALLNTYIQTALYAHNFLVPVGKCVDPALSQSILELLPTESQAKKQEWLAILSFPTKENQHTKEERSFYKLVFAYKQKDKNFDKLLQRHLQKFGWIGTRGYWFDRVWTRKDIMSRIQHFLNQNNDPLTELRRLDQIRKEKIIATRLLFKKLKITRSSKLYRLILLAKEYAFLRTYRTDVIYGAGGYHARSLFVEIAKRAGMRAGDLGYLTYLEVLKMARTQKSPISIVELKRRKEYFADFVIDDKIFVFSGRMLQRKLNQILRVKPKITSEIKGTVAFPGRVSGIVRIVNDPKDTKKVGAGDILVAVMTFPHFIAAMEKAVAFVTDEGGILCHAAIVARELNKPCIIGTKIATKVLKDGDFVEVDADKGVVRILKK